MSFVDVGFSNFVDAKKIIGVNRSDSAPIKRLIQKAKEDGRYVDYTQGRKTRSIILTSCGDDIIVTGSTLLTATIISRLNKMIETKNKENISDQMNENTNQ